MKYQQFVNHPAVSCPLLSLLWRVHDGASGELFLATCWFFVLSGETKTGPGSGGIMRGVSLEKPNHRKTS